MSGVFLRRRSTRYRTGGGGGGGPDPTAYLQYDASQETGYTNGQNITQLLDWSGNARHTTGWGSVGPNITWTSAGFGAGKPGIRLPGQSHFTVPSLAALTEAECFVVIKVDNDPPGAANVAMWSRFGTVPSAAYPFTDGVIYDDFASTAQRTVGNPGPALTTARLYNVISTSSEWTANLDTTQLFTTATNTVGWMSGGQTLGGEVSGGFIHLGIQGYLAEFRLYSTKRTAPQRATIAADLKTKWGLTGY